MKKAQSLNDQIKRYSLSADMHQRIIQPILTSEKLDNPEQLLELLKMLNTQLWQTQSVNQRRVNSGLTELAEIYRYTVTLGQRVHICEHSQPHFGAQEVEVETHWMEFSEDDEADLKRHISHLAAHLSAPKQHKTRVRSQQKVIDLVVPKLSSGTTDTNEKDQPISRYQEVIRQALDQGYHSAGVHVEGSDLYQMTQKVIISTPAFNLNYQIAGPGKVVFDGSSPSARPPQLARRSIMSQHWRALHQQAAEFDEEQRNQAIAEGVDFNTLQATA